MADTDISLSVGLDVKDAEKTAEELQKEIKDIFESKDGEQSASMVNLEIQMKKTYDAAENLKQKMRELSNGEPFIQSEQFQKIDQEFDAISVKLENAWREFTNLHDESMRTGKYNPRVEELSHEIDELTVKFNELEDVRKQMMAEGQDQIPIESTEGYKKLQAQLDLTNDKLKQQIIRYREIERSQQAALDKANANQAMSAQKAMSEEAIAALKQQKQETVDLNRSLMGVTSSVRGLSRLIPGVSASGIYGVRMLTMGVTRLVNLTKKDLVSAVNALKGAISKLFATVASNPIIALVGLLVVGIVLVIKKLKEAHEKITEFVDELSEGIAKALKLLGQLGKKGLEILTEGFLKIGMMFPKLFLKGFRTIISRLNSLKSVVSENIKLMAKWNDGNNDVNRALSNIISSLNYLKATLATVVAPILTTIEPILTNITDKLAEMITNIGMMIAKLTGANSFQRAIKKQKDYAKSLQETNNQLASFDKLNVIGQNDNKSVDFEMVDLQETPIQKWFTDLEKLGRRIGTLVTNTLSKIPWTKVQKQAKKAGQSIAQFINGFTGVEGLGDSIGRTFGKALNTITDFVNSFIRNLDGRKLGWQIGDAFQTMIKVIDFKEIGRIFSSSLNNLMDIITGFTDKFSGTDLGNALTEFLEGSIGEIDWKKVNAAIKGIITDFVQFLNAAITPENLSLVLTTLTNALTTMFTGIKLFGDTAEWKQWGESIGIAINNFFANDEMWTMGAEAINAFMLGVEDMILAAIDKINWVDGPDSVSDRIINFLANINWKDIGSKALEISTKLREGLWKIWQELKDSGAFQDILDVIVDFLNEKDEWEKMVSKIKKDMVSKVFKNNFWHIINPLNWFDWEPLTTKLKEIKEYFFPTSSTHTSSSGTSHGGTHGFFDAPGYASGAVIPPSMSAHLAVLGDNNTETEVVSPLSTMKEALKEALAEQNMNVTFQIEGDPNGIFKVVQNEAKSYNKRTGNYAFGGT